MDPLVIYNLVNSPLTWILLATWILLGIIWRSKFESLIKRLTSLVSKPVIFDNVGDDAIVPFYPRTFLERVAHGVIDIIKQPWTDLVKPFIEFIKNQNAMVFDKSSPLRTFVYLFLLTCLILFAYADAIAIANGLSTLGLLTGEIASFLLRYEYAVGIATFLSVILGFFVFFQTLSKRSDLTHWGDEQGPSKVIAGLISLVIIIIGLTVSILLGIARLIALGFLEKTSTNEFFVQFGMNVLILVNSLLAASITFNEAFRGIVVVVIILQWLVVGISYVLFYVVKILAYIIPFLVDVVWRIVYLVLDILLYFIFVPALAILNPFVKVFEWVRDSIRGSTVVSPTDEGKSNVAKSTDERKSK